MKKNIYLCITIISIAILALIPFLLKNKFNTIEFKIYDIFAKHSTQSDFFKKYSMPPSNEIIIIAHDDLSKFELEKYNFNDFKTYPFTRRQWSKIIDYLEKLNPKVIGLNVIFEGFEDNSMSDYSNDIKLSETIKKYNNIILATKLEFPAKENLLNTEINTDFENETYKPTQFSLNLSLKDYSILKEMTFYKHSQIPNIYTNNNLIGAINLQKGKDKKTRYFTPLYRNIKNNEEYFIPSFPLAMALKADIYKNDFILKRNKIIQGKFEIPINKKGETYINWNGENYTYNTIPLSSIIYAIKNNKQVITIGSKEIPFNLLKNKFFIVTENTQITDLYDTPYSANMTDGEIYATILDNILNDANTNNIVRKKFINDYHYIWEWIIITIISSIILTIVLHIKKKTLNFTITLAILSLYFLISIFIFCYPEIRIWLPITNVFYYAILTLIAGTLIKNILEIHKKKELSKIFKNRVAKKTFNRILKQKKQFNPSPIKKIVTILYIKIEDYNQIEKNNKLKDIVLLQNQIIKNISEAIFKNNGLLENFDSNSITAHFGIPYESNDDEYNAVKCALEINETCKTNDDIKIKMAIYTGESIVACIGENELKRYTVLGESIDITKKIESITASIDSNILIADTTYEKTKKRVSTKYKGEINLKGKMLKLKVFEPIEVLDE